jgi:hypothetical protein
MLFRAYGDQNCLFRQGSTMAAELFPNENGLLALQMSNDMQWTMKLFLQNEGIAFELPTGDITESCGLKIE